MADASNSASNSGSSTFSIINILFVIIGLLVIYYLYRFLHTSAYSSSTVIIPSQQAAITPPTTIPSFPKPYEGGDYSVNTWIYLNSLNTNNKRKHVLEIKGAHFSTLLIAIGSFKNSLIVRTQYTDPAEGFTNPLSDYTSGIVNRVKSVMANAKDGFQSGSGGSMVMAPGSTAAMAMATATAPGSAKAPGSATAPGSGSMSAAEKVANTTANSGDMAGTLSTSALDGMFLPMASDDSLLNGTPLQCDISEIDLQRWTMVTVVLSGKMIDVYIDGKLSRSCVTPSYFKVDPTADVKLNIVDKGGFDGYIGNTTVGSYSMNPDEIYRTYLSGPNGTSLDPLSWLTSLFKGAKLG